jgi:hypothetical protein
MTATVDARWFLLLADYMQDIGAAESNAKSRCAGSVLKCEVRDFGDGHDGIARRGVGGESDDRKGWWGWSGRLFGYNMIGCGRVD